MQSMVGHLFEMLLSVGLPGMSQAPAAGWLGLPPAAVPWVIFGLRALDQTLSTVRTLVTVQGERRLAWILGFIQSFLFITAIAGVLQSLTQPVNLAAYAAGYATGQVLGITLEGRMARGHSVLRVISAAKGQAVVDALRGRGWGVTELPGQGLDGTVGVILCTVPRKTVPSAKLTILGIDASAFVTVQHVYLLGGGWRP
ncbi:MAG: DUF5698 domain-containing protein [Anaerolineales bacterium]|jgi:uncharacterized protein YebE (UPF0316 family)